MRDDDTYTWDDLWTGGPGLDGYAFGAALYCESCARNLDVGEGPWDGHTFFDSECVPQPVFYGEAETAQHCDECGEYLYGPDEDENEEE